MNSYLYHVSEESSWSLQQRISSSSPVAGLIPVTHTVLFFQRIRMLPAVTLTFSNQLACELATSAEHTIDAL